MARTIAGPWRVGVHPAGQSSLSDPYLGLRAWLAVNPACGLMLAGTASAWHLGYLDRQPPFTVNSDLDHAPPCEPRVPSSPSC